MNGQKGDGYLATLSKCKLIHFLFDVSRVAQVFRLVGTELKLMML